MFDLKICALIRSRSSALLYLRRNKDDQMKHVHCHHYAYFPPPSCTIILQSIRDLVIHKSLKIYHHLLIVSSQDALLQSIRNLKKSQ